VPTHKELLGHMRVWSEENKDNIPARFIRAEIMRLERMVAKMDEGTNSDTLSAGASAAQKAAMQEKRDTSVQDKMFAGERQGAEEGRPVDQQPKNWQDAADAAHEKFMQQVTAGRES
jgi:hypothetical protein